MRMMLRTAGTRGDVEPFAALARFAAGHGHEVRLGLPDSSGVELSGLDTVSLEADFHRLVQEHGISPWTAVRHFRTEVGPGMRRMLAAAVRETLAFAPDVVVHHPKVLTAPAVAQALGIPHVVVETVPVLTPTRRFPAPGVVNRDLGRFNRATYVVARGAERMFRRDIDRACAQLPGGRPAAVPAPAATLLPISPQLLPRPDDWPASVHLTGSWHADAPVPEPDPAVREFLRGGPYLVATFGSMASGDRWPGGERWWRAPVPMVCGRCCSPGGAASRCRTTSRAPSGTTCSPCRPCPSTRCCPVRNWPSTTAGPGPSTPWPAPASRTWWCRSWPTSRSGGGSSTASAWPPRPSRRRS